MVSRQKLFDDRRVIINELFARLHCHSNKDSQFVHMICIKKGLRLVGRFIPLLDQVHECLVLNRGKGGIACGCPTAYTVLRCIMTVVQLFVVCVANIAELNYHGHMF